MIKKSHILIVDDTPEVSRIIGLYLQSKNEFSLDFAQDGEEALEKLQKHKPDVILLDIMMPKISGYEVAKIIQSKEETSDIQIIFITALEDSQSILKGFETGAIDYITKPFQKAELIARVTAHARIKILQDDLKEKNLLLMQRELFLETLVSEKTKKIEDITLSMVKALETANFLNDDDTGNHIRRVKEYAELLARKYGCEYDFTKKIGIYASLHDVGKVGIDPYLLKKTGIYTPEEREAMKEHVRFGRKLLEDENIDEMAKNIALYHHEKWDGSGYVAGLHGETIPLEARIVAIADVFDALTTKRVYKPAFSQKETNRIILTERAKHFDPKLVDLYFNHEAEFLQIHSKYSKQST